MSPLKPNTQKGHRQETYPFLLAECGVLSHLPPLSQDTWEVETAQLLSSLHTVLAEISGRGMRLLWPQSGVLAPLCPPSQLEVTPLIFSGSSCV